MTLGNRVMTSWRLGWSGLRVILNDKTLLGFPAVTVAAIIAILSLVYIVIGPNLQILILAAVTDVNAPTNGSLFNFLLILWYFTLAFVAAFMHVALVGAVHISMNERDSKFFDGLSVASRFIPSIIFSTLINYTVGFLLTVLDQFRYSSRFVRNLFGATWSVLTFLSTPIMVVENKNILKAFSQSNRMMEAKWGENLHPSFSLGYFFALLNLPTVVFFAVVYFQPVERQTYLELLGTLYFLLTLVMMQASRSVLMVALYQYAATGQVPARFSEDFLKHAFIPWEQAELASAPAVVKEEPGESA